MIMSLTLKHFNSLIKTVKHRKYHSNDSFEEILNLLDIWINESSAWTIDQIDGLYINTSTLRYSITKSTK